MLSTIKDFIVSIGEGLLSAWDFLISLIEDIVYVIKVTGIALSKIPDIFSWLPAEVLVMLVLLIGVVVVYKVTGREG